MSTFATKSVHAGYTPDATGAVMPAIYATSTYAQPAPGEPAGYEYSRSGNPTRSALENAIAELEGGSRGYAFASGLAACATVLELLDQGSHLVAVDDLYGGTYRLLEKVRSRSAGLRVTYVAPGDSAALEQAIEPDTKMIWVETPTNPLLKLADLAAIAAIAKKHRLIGVVDNTFASPALQRPLEYGFDVVLHSATKYLNGHSDVVAGVAVVGDNPELAQQLGFLHNAVGRHPRSIQQFPDPARYPYPGAAHGTPQQQCAAYRPVAGGPTTGGKRLLSRPDQPSATRAGGAANATVWRYDLTAPEGG
ncbi:Cystathionine beta-lyase [Serratia odorifera]|uniref:Cystathionine beta-lyase n=1 Tax=Serratia odorifera TaxID=618 RepID=A0A447L1T1_SEROD|nr:Cystathionine beta-lyase [Serratia odorifera]